MQKSANDSLMILALENDKHDAYFSSHPNIDIFTLGELHVLKRESNKRKSK